MDPMAIAGMIFTLLLFMLVGGFIVLFPITRRLGAYLEQRLEQGKGAVDHPDIRQLRATVGALQAEIERLAERQDFTESLLLSPARSSRGELPAASAGESQRAAQPAPDR
jgi:hypothetical protein